MKDKIETLIIAAVAKLSDITRDEHYVLDFLEHIADIIEDIKIEEVDDLNTIELFKTYSPEYVNNDKFEEFSTAIDELLNKEN